MNQRIDHIKFLKLLNENSRVISRICCIYSDNSTDREDLKQEIIIQLWNSFNSFRGESAFTTWLYKVSLNTAITFFKKNKRRVDRAIDQCIEYMAGSAVEIANEYLEELEMMYKAINRLPKLDKALVTLYLEDRSYDEISEILGITAVNARVRILRLKEKLKLMLNQ